MTEKKSFNWLYKLLTHTGILLTYVVLIGAALFFYTRESFNYVRLYADSISTVFSIKMGFYAGLFIFSLGPSLLFDKYFNSSRWLNKLFGERYNIDSNAEFDTTSKIVRSGRAQFYLFYGLVFVVSWNVLDSINGNFNSYYRKYGQYLTMMRSPNENDHIKAMKALIKYPKNEVADLLKKMLINGTPKEKMFTAWAIGNYNFQHKDMILFLHKLLNTTKDPKLKLTIMLSLARIETSVTVSFSKLVASELRKYLGENKIPPIQLLFTAAFLRNPDYLKLFLDMYSLKNDTISVILTYSMVWIKGALPNQNTLIIKRLNQNMKKGSIRLKCMTTIAMAFKYEQLDMESLSLLRREFENKNSSFKCKPEIFSLHPFNKKSDTINITRLNLRGFKYPALGPIRYRERILRVLALNRDETLIPWFKRMYENKQLSKYIKQLIFQIINKKSHTSHTVNW